MKLKVSPSIGGSQVISNGARGVEDRRYRAGVGVATALLLRNRIPGSGFQRGQVKLDRIVASGCKDLAGSGKLTGFVDEFVETERLGNDHFGLQNRFAGGLAARVAGAERSGTSACWVLGHRCALPQPPVATEISWAGDSHDPFTCDWLRPIILND